MFRATAPLRFLLVGVFTCAGLIGCVERTISITSDPPGALLTLNGREIGRTPVDVDFVYYGTYDVVLEKDGYEPLLTSGDASAPIWDNVPLDLFAEMVPGTPRSHIHWHYTLQPRNDDPTLLLERAAAVRALNGPPTTSPATAPATSSATSGKPNPSGSQPAIAP